MIWLILFLRSFSMFYLDRFKKNVCDDFGIYDLVHDVETAFALNSLLGAAGNLV